MTNANPSVDPANLDSLTGAFREVFKKFMQGVDGMLPATVIAFDRGPPPRAQVQPEIMMVTTAGEILPRAQIASIPVLQFGGGGFVLSFNLKTGDKGWIVASDRDISNFLKTVASAAPNTYRMKNFADGLFIPDVMINYTLASEDAQNAVLQSLDGTVKISLGTDKIKIAAPTIEIEAVEAINITSPLTTIDGALTVTGPIATEGGLTNSGGGATTMTSTGDLRIIGNITASGNITPNVP
jgi:hypothetical protein